MIAGHRDELKELFFFFFKVQYRPMDFNVTKYKKFIVIISDSTFH